MTTSTQMTLFDQPLPPSIVETFGGISNIPEKQTVPQLSFRGKVWRIIINGEETIARNSEGDPVQSVKLVLLNLHAKRSRAYFEGAYEEGKSQMPACWSNDGVTPDASIATPQGETCASCPKAAKGSKVSDAGKPMAACSTFRRVAVVPATQLDFEPLMLKIPQTSIWDKDNAENEAKGLYAFDQYLDMLRSRGITHTAAVVTRVKFDPRTSYPKLLFQADAWVPTEQHPKIKELLADPRVEALLNVSATALAARDESMPETTAAEPATAPAAAPAAAPAKPAATKPAVQKGVPPPPPRKAAPAPAAAPAADPDEMALPPKGNGKAGPATIDATPTAKSVEPATAQAGDPALKSLLNGWDD